jgi:translocation and assembly module TamA
MGTVKIRILFLALFPLSIWAARLQYEVRFAGLENPVVLTALKNTSDLISLKDRPPATVNGLQYRAQADIPKLLQVMKAYAYYDAHITYEIRVENDLFYVDLFVHSGPLYSLGSYEIFHGECLDSSPIPRCPAINSADVGLKLGQIADSTSIVNAEMAALTQLARCGYPLAYIDKRRIIVDMAEKKVDASICVQEGPLCRFGPITFFGLKSVNPRFIDRKITWKEGEIFDPGLIDQTQNRLLKSDLFSSVLITHAEELDEAGELSMKIRLAEAKHRSISVGFFYATVDGPGGTVCWIHRNLRGMGEYLGIQGDVSKRFIGGSATYRKPDFFHIDQTFSALAKASRENIVPYLAFTYIEANRIERQLNSRSNISIGLNGQYINVHKSVNNGHYFVLGLPLAYDYSSADSPLDPTKGCMLLYNATPYQSLSQGAATYVKQRLTGNFYIPLTNERKVVLALHAQFGSIAGAPQNKIPLPLLFFGGSEDDLRGYGYKTVSPLGRKKGKTDKDSPRGGRSAIFTTVEFRFRVTKSIGIVPFADFGTVTLNQWPQIHAKWFKSVGAGLRYYTFFGPLRLDIGIPLDRRKNLDTWGKVYASIGQCF